MAYRHRALNGTGTTRLLILHPASIEPEPLCGSLMECSLKKSHDGTTPERPTPYEALSYVWGAPSTAHGINIDSSTLPITANCDAAMRRLRRTSEDRVLWIDSICIDQTPEGVEERNTQVAMMGDIYENASNVLIWLGEGDEKTDALFLHLNRLYELSDESWEDARAEMNVQFMNECDTKWRMSEAISQVIEDLLSRPWFERMWTLQELLLSSHATVQCGGQSMSWDAFCQALMLVEASFAPSSKGSRNFINCYFAYSDFKDLVAANADAQATRTRMDDEFVSNDVQKDLSTVVHHTRLRHATDPKDKIFAIYAVSLKLGKPLPVPDYTESISVIYAKATVEIMRQNNSLWPLDNVWSENRRPGLPSWVPDWSDDPRWSEDLLSELPVNHGDREAVIHWDGPVDNMNPHIIVSSDHSRLKLMTQIYGTIDTVFDSRELVAAQRDVLTNPRTSTEYALAVRRHGTEQIGYFRRIYTSLSAEKDAQLRFQTFCRLLLTYSPTQPLRSFELGSKALLSLLAASADLETRQKITVYALDKLRKAVDINQRHESIVALVESNVDAALDVLLSLNLDCGAHEVYAKPHEPGYKVIHLLASAAGLYSLIRGLVINRSIFTTSNGLIGYAQGQVCAGDIIAKFQGATSPHVLHVCKSNTYRILSPAVVKADCEISTLVEGQHWTWLVLI
ncbi:heterokaryon incompatibility protein-domain-containing protein [Hypoxylon cercidicola]|nr:heterokaryon incompatibility protein-domain-containing protein [Hypoxylon cercidicola]